MSAPLSEPLPPRLKLRMHARGHAGAVLLPTDGRLVPAFASDDGSTWAVAQLRYEARRQRILRDPISGSHPQSVELIDPDDDALLTAFMAAESAHAAAVSFPLYAGAGLSALLGRQITLTRLPPPDGDVYAVTEARAAAHPRARGRRHATWI